MAGSTERLLQALADNAARDRSDACSLPPAIYHDTGVYELELEKVFGCEWICIGRAAELANPGDFICSKIVDTPVFAIRQRDASIKAFANICAHRSSRLLSGAGHVSRISCPYHSWTYEIDGRLIGAPFMQRTAGFETRDYRLKQFECEQWQGFVYVSLDSKMPSLAKRLNMLEGLIGDYRIADYVPVFSMEETWQTNWKCLVENFMDAYHLHRVHRNSFAQYGSSEETTELFEGDETFTYHFVEEESGPKSVQAHPDNTWLTGANRHRTWLINIFPSHVIQLQPDMLWYLSILPKGIDQVSIRWAVSVPAEILNSVEDRQAHIDELLALLRLVNSEDRPVVENVFRTTASSHATPGPLSYLERNVREFGCYLARRLCS